MASLRQLATRVINNIGEEFNIPLYERVKDMLITARAEMLQQSIDKRGAITDHYRQRYTVRLQKTDAADTCVINANCTILRTVNKIATPLRYTTDTPFLFVGSIDGKLTFTYAKRSEIQYVTSMKYISKAIRYVYLNNYIYVYLNTKLKYISVEAVYENPTIVSDECTGGAICYTDDMEFPAPLDIINRCMDRIYKELKGLPIEDKVTQVEIIKEESKQ